MAVGEIGLSGECRAVGNIEQRVREAARLGFTKIIIPKRNYERSKQKLDTIKGKAEIVPVASLIDCLRIFSADNK